MQETENTTEQYQEARTDERDLKSGSDLPTGSGTVSDEDVNHISGEHHKNAATGKDHSTENYGETMPDHGVGAVQDNSDTTSDIAHIND